MILLMVLAENAAAASFTEMIQDVNMILYAITAGVAILLIVFHAIKWKLAESPDGRMEARKGIINVILGMALIIIAASLVTLLYKIPESKPTPMLIGATTLAVPGATEFEFTIMNTMDFDLTNVRAIASSITYSSCTTDHSHERPFGDIPLGGSVDYSHNNFCHETTEFSIIIFCDQDIWQYCAICPSAPGGNCNVRTGGC